MAKMTDNTQQNPDGRIVVQQRGKILMIGIDRPDKRNGFTPKMFEELAAAYSMLERTDDLSVGVIHAFGEHFTAGLDLPKIAPLRREGRLLYSNSDVDPFNLREPYRRKPTVIALKGICFTLAVELMLASDVAIAAENCRFAQLEVKRGIMAGCGATIRMVQRAGWGHAMKLLLTGDEFSAQEALRLNFVQEVVPTGQELARAMEIAEKIAQQAPLAVQATIENARISLGNGPLVAASRIPPTQHRLFNTEDAKEGVLSFQEKRQARFVGK